MMKRPNQERRRNNPRRHLRTELLEDRRLLAAYDFVPANSIGVQREEIDGITVLTVAPGSKIKISAQVTSADDAIVAFAMNFNETDSSVVLDNFQLQLNPNDLSEVDTDLDLDSDRLISAGFPFATPVSVPPVLTFGTFDVKAPSATGDYRVTVDTSQSESFPTGVVVIGDDRIAIEPITDFGDFIIRVQGEAVDTVALDLLPSDVTANPTIEEGGKTVVTVAPGTALDVVVKTTMADSLVQGYQLNFSNSASPLVLTNYRVGSEFTLATDAVVDSAAGDNFVSSANISGVEVPPTRDLGLVNVQAPTATGDYTLTVNFTDGNDQTNTLIREPSSGATFSIADFGDLIFRVVDMSPLPTVSISTSDQIVNEDVGSVTLTATLSTVSDTDVSVPFTVSGTATLSNDFTISATPLVIPAGNLSADITIAVIDDDVVESGADETVIVSLGTPTGATLGTTTMRMVSIVDDDEVPVINTATLDLVPETGLITTEENGVTVVTVAPGAMFDVIARTITADAKVQGYQLNFINSASELVVSNYRVGTNFSVSTDTIIDSATGDYFVSSANIAGVDVPPTADFGTLAVTAPTTSGDYRLTTNFTSGDPLSNTIIKSPESGAAFAITDFGDIIVRVQVDLTVPTVSFSTNNQSVVEGSGPVTITATLSAASDTDVTLPFTVTGTATGGSDFTITSSPITIAAGATSGNIIVTIIDDAEVEMPETVVIGMGTPTGATLGARTSQTITINDNEPVDLPTVKLGADFSVEENVGTISLPVTLSAASGSLVSIPFTVTGTATDGSDFTISASPVTISAGATSGNIAVVITDDLVNEEIETIILTLGTPTGATVGATGTQTVSILANDPVQAPTVSFNLSGQSIRESDGMLTLTVSLSAVSESPVTVPFNVSGTAIAPADYSISASPLTIAAGQTSASIDIIVVDDDMDEPNESIIVTLGTPTGADLGSQTVNTTTIIDDDAFIPTDNVRVFSPSLVGGPLVVPGDGFSSTVIFGAVLKTTLSVGQVGSVAVNGLSNVGLFDENLNPMAFDSQGVLTAQLQAGSLYALVFKGDVDRRIFRIGSSAGFDALVQTARTNIVQRTDVNGSGETTSMDALLVINQLGRQGGASGEAVASTGRFYDVNADGRVSALDALQVINRLQIAQTSRATSELITERISRSGVTAEATDSVIAAIKIRDAESEKAAAFDVVENDIGGGYTTAIASSSDEVDQVMAELDQQLSLLNQ
ncbi:Calx-beta domain-containing protein [Novipirellula sp. SH528]|uniref:Calx-beta domain-containing protein n=1 Tax=Novipirellula sp. SH528 TaxID=3454466 RepID=UPI003F9F230A